MGKRLGVTEFLPEFFRDVRRVWREQLHERFEHGARAFVLRGEFVDENHHLRNGGVERERFGVSSDFLNGLVQHFHQLCVRCSVVHEKSTFFVAEQTPDATKEPVNTFGALRVPRLGRFERTHKHFVESQRIRAVFADDVVGIDDIAPRFAHLPVVFAENHSLVDEACEWLRRRDVAEIEQHFVPEARVK